MYIAEIGGPYHSEGPLMKLALEGCIFTLEGAALWLSSCAMQMRCVWALCDEASNKLASTTIQGDTTGYRDWLPPQ